jgi:hypothetical protein
MTPVQIWLALFGFVSAAAAAINNFLVLSAFVHEHFLLVFTASGAMLLFSVWPRKGAELDVGFRRTAEAPPSRPWRFRYVIAVLAAYATVTGAYVWETKFRSTHGKPFQINPRDSRQFWDMGIARAAAARESSLKLVSFGLDLSRTSFEEREETDSTSKSASRERLKTFALMREWFQAADPNSCRKGVLSMFSDWLDADVRTIKAFTFYLRMAHKEKFIPYLGSNINQDLVSKRSDIVGQIIPRGAEWDAMENAGNEGKDASKVILNWVKFCVGIPFPVFRFVVQNTDKHNDVAITRLDYVVRRLDGYKGAEPGALHPLYTYWFDLPYKVGRFRQDLDPPFVVPKGMSAAFDLKLFTSHPDVGLVWRMAIDVISSGGTASTNDFQLMMSGEPNWAPPHLK